MPMEALAFEEENDPVQQAAELLEREWEWAQGNRVAADDLRHWANQTGGFEMQHFDAAIEELLGRGVIKRIQFGDGRIGYIGHDPQQDELIETLEETE